LMQPSTGKLGPFRIAVIEGKVDSIKSHRPDLNFAGIIAVPDEDATGLFETKVVSAYQGPPITETVAQGLLARVPVADKTIEANAYREGLLGGGGDNPANTGWGSDSSDYGTRRPGTTVYDIYGEEKREKKGKEEGMSNTTMYLIGGVCVAGVLLYVYK